MNNRTTYTRGTRVAHVDKVAGWAEWVVSVWNDNGNVAARWFKRFSTCSQEYSSFERAEKAAQKFLAH